MNGEKIKTGNLITINTMVENNRTMDHLNALNTVGTTTYYSYAFVGLRKTCQTCSLGFSKRNSLCLDLIIEFELLRIRNKVSTGKI